jgi:hypothetical protein
MKKKPTTDTADAPYEVLSLKFNTCCWLGFDGEMPTFRENRMRNMYMQ